MDKKEHVSNQDLLGLIVEFVGKASGLSANRTSDTQIRIMQKADTKEIKLESQNLAEVIFRKDPQSRDFIQVNLTNGEKILLTDELVGFKPLPTSNFGSDKLPKVVTTMDLFAVLEAIEETLSETPAKPETESLKNIFHSILLGGEKVGFDLSSEKTWLKRLPSLITKSVS